MGTSKVVIKRNGVPEVLVDLTSDNVDPDALVVGFTAHDKTGEVIEGSNPYGKAETDNTVSTQSDLIQQIKTGLAEAEENMGRTNNEISSQSDLIQQIKTALEGKAAGGGVELPVLDNPGGAEDLRMGKQLIDQEGNIVTGTALVAGGGFIYPDGAFAPVTSFTAGKQYALVAVIDGVRRYINTTTYNDYTMNATQVTIGEDAGDYVIFSNTPVMFTAVASGDGFLLQNGSNYLHGTSSGGTSLRVGTTQMVWTVDTSATAGFSDGKYYAKEDSNAVWLMNNTSGYNWSIKYETAGSFGYDREGRDNTYSTGFVSFVLYEYVAGEGELNPVVDSSDASVTADQMLAGASGYAKGKLVEGNIQGKGAATITPDTTPQYIEPGVYLAGRQTIAAIQTETKTVTANGNYTPSSGKYFSSFTVNVPTGGGSTGGSVIKTGTTTSATIATGLSSIEEFFIYKESQTATGLIHLRYSKTGGTSYLYASAWSTNNYGTKTVTNATNAATVNGGSITLPSSTATSGGLSSGVTYKWTAIGTE